MEEPTFADYFVVCGLDPDAGLELERYSEAVQDSGEERPPLERSYTARILAHYPDARAGRPFPAEVLPLCMPAGLRFLTQREIPTAGPSFHTIANIRADGTRLDGAVLTFYEPVEDERICDAMQTLHAIHVRELTAAAEGPEKETLLHDGYHPPGTVSGGSHTLPRRGRAQSNAKKAKGKVAGLSGRQNKRSSYYEPGKDALFVSKAIAIISRLPMVQAPAAVLRALHELGTGLRTEELPLESFVYWILHQVPLPPPAGTLKVKLASRDVLCQRPGPEELPFLDFSIRELFELVSLETFLKVYTCVLLEHQVLLCSRSLGNLMLVGEALCGLLLPFRWQHAYVPILPYSQATFLELPLPFIMGLPYEDVIPHQVFQSTVCILDIDSGALQMPEDVPFFPDRNHLLRQLHALLDSLSSGSPGPPEDPLPDAAARPPPPPLRNKIAPGGGSSARDALKRMSRSFDNDMADAMMMEGSPSPPDISLAESPLPKPPKEQKS